MSGALRRRVQLTALLLVVCGGAGVSAQGLRANSSTAAQARQQLQQFNELQSSANALAQAYVKAGGCSGAAAQACTQDSPALLLAASPAAFDARDNAQTGGVAAVSGLRDQGSCFTCAAFAVVAAAEMAVARATRTSAATLDLSEQDLQFCSSRGQQTPSCSSAWTLDDAVAALLGRQQSESPLLNEACLPYAPDAISLGEDACSTACSRSDVRLLTPGDAFSARRPLGLLDMQQCLLQGGGLVSRMEVPAGFRAWFAASPGNRRGVYSRPVAARDVQEQHAVALVGFNNTGRYWVAKNSWGRGFGDAGFFRIAYGIAGIGDPRYTWCIGFQPASPPPLGRDLLFPTSNTSLGCRSYIARTGDYLSGIAQRYSVPLHRLLADNQAVINDLQAPLAGKRLQLCGLSPDSPYVVPETQLDALLRARNVLDASGHLALAGWRREAGANGSYCSWKGIECNGGRPGNVTAIWLYDYDRRERLDGIGPLGGRLLGEAVLRGLPALEALGVRNNSMAGPLPRGWGSHPALARIDVGDNKLVGTLPQDWAALAHAKKVLLDHNRLVGPLPDWGALGSLQFVAFAFNQLTGPLNGTVWSRCRSLQHMLLQNNSLTGQLPPALSALSRLQMLEVSANKLEGTLPVAYSKLSRLEGLYVSLNRLRGRLPPEYAELRNLVVFECTSNFLTSTLPTAWRKLTKLRELHMWENGLTGSIPPEWSEMASLTSLSLSWNKLTGPLPASFSALSNLQALVLHFNRFTGTLPPSWGALRKLWFLSPGGLLHGPLPPEWGNMTGLSELYLGPDQSNVTGTVPASWGGMTNLTLFWVYGLPRLTGCVPHAWKLRGVRVAVEESGLDARVFCDAR